MEKEIIEKIINKFKLYPKIKLVYLFGSRVTGKVGPMSDYDFAVYLDEKNNIKRFNLRLELISKIGKILKTEKIDLVVINDIDGPEFKYDIIKNGRLIYKKEPFKVLVEPRILSEYFDFRSILKKYNLTKM